MPFISMTNLRWTLSLCVVQQALACRAKFWLKGHSLQDVLTSDVARAKLYKCVHVIP